MVVLCSIEFISDIALKMLLRYLDSVHTNRLMLIISIVSNQTGNQTAAAIASSTTISWLCT